MRIFTISLIALSFLANAQTRFSVQIDYSIVFNQVEPYIYNLPHTESSWMALNGSKFTENKNRKPLSYRLPLSLAVVKDFKTKKGNLFTLGLRYGRYTRTDTLGGRLRYTDMIDPSAGFVNSSVYYLESGSYLYHTIGAHVGYALEDMMGNTKHRLGASLSVEHLFRSTYFLNHIDTRNGTKSDYQNIDLASKDKIWLVMPSVDYSSNILSRETDKWWIAASYRFSLQDKYENGPLGCIATLGIKKYL